MSWAVGFDSNWNRDIGYGVPAYCDHPGCTREIDRGLAYVCADQQPYGGERGCGRYYCPEHALVTSSEEGDGGVMCGHADDRYISPDHPDWIRHKLTDIPWKQWRDENPESVAHLAQTQLETSRKLAEPK